MDFGVKTMWVIIEEKRVRHRWECAKCNKVEYVPPWYYSEMGTPVCKDCDEDMEYVHTDLEIDTLHLKRFF